MNQIILAMAFFFMAIGIISYAKEIGYSNCKSMQDVIAKETQEIAATDPADHDELAQLHVSRGESYLLDLQYENAVKDFQNANFHLGYFSNTDVATVVAFRAAFGDAISYDNLGMHEQTQQALQQLQTIVSYIGCTDCIEHAPCQDMILPSTSKFQFRNMISLAVNTMHFCDMIISCKNEEQENQDSYADILGPNQPPESNWCEEVVVGVAASMQVIAAMAPNWAVKSALVGVLEALKQRGLKCCQAGGFWKACVAPIARKRREWKNNKERNVFPNAQNLPFYIN